MFANTQGDNYKENNTFKELGVGFSLFFQIISCIFLTIGVLKINKLVYFETGSGIKKSQMFMHLGSFYLYLASLIVFQVQLATDNGDYAL